MAPAPKSQSVHDLPRAENRDIWRLTSANRVARAQALVRRRVPVGVSLSDDLIADRRREAARDR